MTPRKVIVSLMPKGVEHNPKHEADKVTADL